MSVIKARLESGNTNVYFELPCNEETLQIGLVQLNAPVDDAAMLTMTDIIEPAEFKFLNGQKVNLDELNYLAKRMDSFTPTEQSQLFVASDKTNATTVKELINLTFNLHHFTLVQDVSNVANIGRMYVLNTRGGIPVSGENPEEFAEIGRNLIKQGKTEMSERGLLVYNPLEKLEEVYDGINFPEYDWEGKSLLQVAIYSKGHKEYVYLPDNNSAITKAMNRLSAVDEDDCRFSIESSRFTNDSLYDLFEYALENEGIEAVNNTLNKLAASRIDHDRLMAIIDYTDAKSMKDVDVLIDHDKDFGVIFGAEGDEDIGHYFIDNCDDYHISIELEEYFDFSAFGEAIQEEHEGRYIGENFVYYNGSASLSQITDLFEQKNEPEIEMGGM